MLRIGGCGLEQEIASREDVKMPQLLQTLRIKTGSGDVGGQRSLDGSGFDKRHVSNAEFVAQLSSSARDQVIELSFGAFGGHDRNGLSRSGILQTKVQANLVIASGSQVKIRA